VGDEAWPKMSKDLDVPRPCGWYLRTSELRDGGMRHLEFAAGATTNRKDDWFIVKTPLRPCPEQAWQHVAVCKEPAAIALYWNGKLEIRLPCRGIQFHAAPT